MKTPEYREQRLETYKEAINNNRILPGYPNICKQICHYDQLVMIHKELLQKEKQLKDLESC